VVGASGCDAVAAVGYREVVKREFARESPPPFRSSSGVRGSPSVSLYRPRNRPVVERSAFDIPLQRRRYLAY